MRVLSFAFCIVVCGLGNPCWSQQNYLYATGNPSFSTQLPVQNGFVDLNNGNLHLEIPLSTHSQRGSLQLAERLVYDSRIWKTVSNGSSSWQPTNVANSAGGWRFTTGLEAGSVSNSQQDYSEDTGDACRTRAGGRIIPDFTVMWSTHSQFQWTDPQGTSHMFPVETSEPIQVCYDDTSHTQATGVGYALDTSGYYLVVTNYSNMTVYDQAGNQVYPNIVDRNGNAFSVDNSGNLVDTQGNTPVTVSTSGNQTFYDVLSTGGARQRYTVTMGTISYNTSFGQPNVADVSGSFSTITSIGLPDGTSYIFNYDTGSYAELTSITLPGGGVESFGYSSYSDVYGNVNRWVTSRLRDGGTTQISPLANSGCSYSSPCDQSVTVTSPSGNDTEYVMHVDSEGTANNSSQTQLVLAFQGSQASGNQLLNQRTVYSWQQVAGGDGTYSYQSPTQIAKYFQYPSANRGSQTITTLQNGYLPSTSSVWDFYDTNNVPTNATLVTSTTYGYVVNGALLPTQTSVTDGAGNQISQTSLSYDGTALASTTGLPNHYAVSGARGNVTGYAQWVNTSNGSIQTSMSYDDAGVLLASTTPLGTTSYGHDVTDTFVTTSTPPTPPSGVNLTTSQSYDASSGVLLSSTDANGAVTQYQSFDVFDRPQQIVYADGGIENLSYSQTQIIDRKDFDSQSVRSQTTVFLDGYGRTMKTWADNSGQIYQTDSCYDSEGRQLFVSVPHSTSSGPINCAGTGDTYSYDALSRLIQVSKADGTALTQTYAGAAVRTVDENGVSRIIQNSLFGQPLIVCEISSSTNLPGGDQPQSCGTDIAGTGFVTTYAYDLANHKSTIAQGVQTRIFQTDSLGRTVLTLEPERGQTTYSYAYNGAGPAVTRTRPAANQTGGAVTTTTAQSDNQGRLTAISYSDGTATKTYNYDQASGGNVNFGASKGRLTTASVSGNELGAAYTAQTQWGYDVMGRPNAMAQCLPNWCGNANQNLYRWAAYNYGSQLVTEQYSTLSAGAGVVTINNTFDTGGRVTGVSGGQNNASGAPNIVFYPSFTPFGPDLALFGNQLTAPTWYDSAGRISARWVCSGSTQAYCSGGTQLYGFIDSVQGRHLNVSVDTVMNEGMSWSYDDFGRLSSQNYWTGAVNTALAFNYDRYGNRWSQTPTSGSAPSPSLSYNTATNQIVSPGYSYDAAGNLLSDGMHSYTYDAEGNLTQIDGGGTASYVYDALNQRVKVTANGNVQRFGFDLAGRLATTWADRNTLSEVSAKYYAGPGGKGIAYWLASDSNIHFEHGDWLGTERMRTSNSGSVEATFNSLPFGDSLLSNGGDTDPEHFAMLDQDTLAAPGLQHATFREYHATSGRWTSPDPYDGSYDISNPQSLNRYSYAGNSPLVYTDQSGQTYTITTSAGTFSYSDSDWANMMANGYGGGISIDNNGNISCGGTACGSVSWTPDVWFSGVGQSSAGGGTGGGGGGTARAPSNQPTPQQQAVDQHIKDCEAKASAASAQQPSLAPNGNSLLTGLFNAGVTLYRTEKLMSGVVGFVQGLVVRPIVNGIQKEAAYNATLNACLNPGSYMNGVGMVW